MRCSYFITSSPNHATYFSACFGTDDELEEKRRIKMSSEKGFVFVELEFLEETISTIFLGQGSANFCCKGPDSKGFGLNEPRSLCCDGVQDKLPQTMEPWHIKYHKLKEFF